MERKYIIEYLPEFLQEYREIKEITNSEQIELDIIWGQQGKILNNFFVMDADDAGVSRYESMLGLVKKPGETLDERKFNVIVKINEQLPYTITALNEKLEKLCGAGKYTIDLHPETYSIVIKLALTAEKLFLAVKAMILRVLPCNLIYNVIIMYNQHKTLSKYTHAQLRTMTHKQMREEVLI